MLSSALASSSRLRINTKAGSGLGLREHFFPRLFEQSTVAPAQACQDAAGNLLEQRIYFRGHEWIGSHGAQPLRFDPALLKDACKKRGAAKSEKLGIKPTRDCTAEKGTVADTAGTIEKQEGNGTDKCDLGDAAQFQSHRHHEQKQGCHFQLWQNGGVGYEYCGNPSPGREQDTIARHKKEMTELAAKCAKEIEEEKLPLPDNHLHVASNKIKDQHIGEEMPDVVIEQRGGKKLPGVSVRNTAIAKAEIFENESAIPGGENDLGNEGRRVQTQQ